MHRHSKLSTACKAFCKTFQGRTCGETGHEKALMVMGRGEEFINISLHAALQIEQRLQQS